jgi:hypothetical protein
MQKDNPRREQLLMIKPSQMSKKKTETVRQKKRKALDDQTKSDLRQKDSKQKTKKNKL